MWKSGQLVSPNSKNGGLSSLTIQQIIEATPSGHQPSNGDRGKKKIVEMGEISMRGCSPCPDPLHLLLLLLFL